MKSRLAPAKINLALHVTGQRADGYHLLDTLVTFADPAFPAACDEVRMEVAEEDSLTISGPESEGLDVGADNLILQAVQALREHGYPVPPVRMELVKNLPIASGIGGGSADAAAALHLANSFLDHRADQETLSTIGLSIGADVPMCLMNAPLRAEGIGEVMAEVIAPALHMVLVNLRMGVSTPSVFKELASKNNAPMDALPSPTTDFTTWLAQQRNDLEAAARGLCPQIDSVLRALRRSSNIMFARMSGSGATCFGLYPTQAHADGAALALAEAHSNWWITSLRTVPTHALPMEEAS
ncbi:MAG: 4-(cytidine 5'-diphospho)-2-C-methyl-D-erythritol kinase [Pseudomonadota bacterium]